MSSLAGSVPAAREFDCVVFDWDGTLMDSTALIASCIQAACTDLELPVPSRERASHVIGLGLVDALAYCVPTMPQSLMPRVAERYRYHYLAGDGALALFPGAVELLQMLKASGMTIAVATGKPRVGLDRALRACGLVNVFDATRCADESRPKPDPQLLLDLSALLGIVPARMLMVGDTTHDLAMAASAAAQAVAVSYGAHAADSLDAHGVRSIFHSMAELRSWLATRV